MGIEIYDFLSFLRNSGLILPTSGAILSQKVMNIGYFSSSPFKLRSALKSILINRQQDTEIFNDLFDIYFDYKNVNSNDSLKSTIMGSLAEVDNQNDSLPLEKAQDDRSESSTGNQGAIQGSNLYFSHGLERRNERNTINTIVQRFVRWLPESQKDTGKFIALSNPSKWQEVIDNFIDLITGEGQYLRYAETLARRYNRFAMSIIRAYDQVVEEITSQNNISKQLVIIGQTEFLKERIKEFLSVSRLNLINREFVPINKLMQHLYSSILLPDQFKVLRTDFSDLQVDILETQKQLLLIGKKIAIEEKRKRKKSMKGKLNVRKTIRKNISSGGILFNLVLNEKKRKDPRIIILSDVSGSTEYVSEFFFTICYAAQTVFKKLLLFEFDNTTVEITQGLRGNTLQTALKNRIKLWEDPPRSRVGHSNYQTALEDFYNIINNRLTSSTTLLILGDCRDWLGEWKVVKDENIYGYQRTEPVSKNILKKIRKRVKRIIILNPEHPSRWGTGDSVSQHFIEAGANIYYVENLLTLINFIFKDFW